MQPSNIRAKSRPTAPKYLLGPTLGEGSEFGLPRAESERMSLAHQVGGPKWMHNPKTLLRRSCFLSASIKRSARMLTFGP